MDTEKEVVYTNKSIRTAVKALLLFGMFALLSISLKDLVPSLGLGLQDPYDFLAIFGLVCLLFPLGIAWSVEVFEPKFRIDQGNVRLVKIRFKAGNLRNPLEVLGVDRRKREAPRWGWNKHPVASGRKVLNQLAPFQKDLGRNVCTVTLRTTEPTVAVLRNGELVPVEAGTYYIPVYLP